MPSSHVRIDRYEVQETIGRGAMGVVYRALDPVIGRIVALKMISLPEGLSGHVRHDSLKRFAREARAAGVLSHPNIVTVYDVGEIGEDGSSYIAMEFVEGRTLREMIPRGARRSPEEILDVALQVVRALDYAHRRGIVHRDVKPANILVRDDGLVKLADFGVARIESSDLTRTGQSVGSPSYLSPEVLQGETLDGRADLFSFGIILYEILSGQKPFRAETLASLYHQILSVTPPPPSSLVADIPAEWDALIMKLLAKNPADRYTSASHLLEDLRCLEAGRPLLHAGPGTQEAPAGAVPDDPQLPCDPTRTRTIQVRDVSSGATFRPRFPGPRVKAWMALAAVAGFALTIIVVALLVRHDGLTAPAIGARGAPAAAAPAPATLTLRLVHNLKAGRIAVMMDGRPILTDSFRGERERIRIRGSLARRLEVPGGRHRFRVTVADEDGRSWTGLTTRELAGGSGATLRIRLRGFLRKGLELTWL